MKLNEGYVGLSSYGPVIISINEWMIRIRDGIAKWGNEIDYYPHLNNYTNKIYKQKVSLFINEWTKKWILITINDDEFNETPNT